MIICSYQKKDEVRFGIIEDGSLYRATWDVLKFKMRKGKREGPCDAFQYLPPARPSKIICVGRNYASHAAELGNEVPSEPLIFFKPPSALTGNNTEIQLLPEMGRVDHEAELAVVIGKGGRFIPEDQALDHVLGYTCANDISERDYQKSDELWTRAKGFDTFCSLGPWLVTELDIADLAIRCRVNGELRQESRTSLMNYKVPNLISFISRIMTLEPDDVILTGTPAGVSQIHPGDYVEVEIEGIGSLHNTVVLLSK